jgi:hypothetical protein
MRLVALALLAALAGCPTIDLGDPPVAPGSCRPDPGRFREEGTGIWDVALAPADPARSCIAGSGCHAQATGRSALRLIDKPRDEMTDADWAQNYEVVTRFLNCSTPEASSLITKPSSGGDPHAGGDLWDCTAQDCEPQETVETWILGG